MKRSDVPEVSSVQHRLVPVSAETFNQRLTTVTAFFGWSFDLELGQLSSKHPMRERIEEHKAHVDETLARAFVSEPGSSTALVKDLEDAQLESFRDIVSYRNPDAYGVNKHVRRLQQAAIDLFEGDERAAWHWLHSPLLAFGGKRPIDVELSEVLRFIGQIEYGSKP